MNLFYKQHPTLLPVVFMALLAIGCTSKKVERLKAKPHPTQQDIGLHEGQHKPALQPIAIGLGVHPRCLSLSKAPVVETKPIRILVHPHKSRLCRAVVIL